MGIFGSLGKLVGKGIKAVAPHVPGVGTVVSGAQALAGRVLKKKAKAAVVAVGAGAVAAGAAAKKFAGSRGGQAVMIGAGGAAAGAIAEHIMGGGGGGGRRYRRINPGNTRAMRRAIRRIESGARLYSKFFAVRHGKIKGAHGVHVKKLSIRRAA